MERFGQQIAVVTGAGRGIGRLVALRLAREGAHVALLSRTPAPLAEVRAEIEQLGLNAHALAVDVSSAQAVNDAFAEVIERLGTPTILVNCAQGWGLPEQNARDVVPTPLEDLTPAEWEHTYRTGFGGTLNCMLAALPGMRDNNWGRIVNFYSPIAAQSGSGYAAYNSTKDAIRSLTRTAAREWGRHGITVNCVSPLVLNDGQRDRLGEISDTQVREAIERTQREQMAVWDSADPARDVPAVVAFLASEEAAFLTGEVVRVDGGLSL